MNIVKNFDISGKTKSENPIDEYRINKKYKKEKTEFTKITQSSRTNEGILFEDGCRYFVETSLYQYIDHEERKELSRTFKCFEFRVYVSESKKAERFFEEYDSFLEKKISFDNNLEITFTNTTSNTNKNKQLSVDWNSDEWEFKVIFFNHK